MEQINSFFVIAGAIVAILGTIVGGVWLLRGSMNKIGAKASERHQEVTTAITELKGTINTSNAVIAQLTKQQSSTAQSVTELTKSVNGVNGSVQFIRGRLGLPQEP